eukprot:PITA_10221
METVHALVVISVQHKWKVYQMDVKLAFLNGVLKDEVYVVQNPSYEVEGQEDKVYQLRELTLYITESDGKILIVVLYVDDLIFMESDDFLIAYFKQVMKNEFGMADLGLLRFFLGIEVKQTRSGIFISQAKYVTDILERFKMQNNKLAPTPTVMGFNLSKEDCSSNVNPTLYKGMIDSLMYFPTTGPDIMYAVDLVSMFIETPKETQWQATKKILRYVNRTKE